MSSLERKNIITLVKIQFWQNRQAYLGLMCLELGCLFLGIVRDMQSAVGLVGIRAGNMGEMLCQASLLTVYLIALRAYNNAQDKKISMYPGTKKTRYLSRLLFDHLFLTAHAAYLAVLYLLSYGIYLLIHLALPQIRLQYFFSWQYLFAGCVRVFLFSMALYSLANLVYLLAYWLGMVRSVLACVVLWIAGAAVVGKFPSIFQKVKEFFLAECADWQELFLCYFLVWIILFFVGGALFFLHRKLFCTSGRVVWGLCVTAILFVCGWDITVDVIASEYGDGMATDDFSEAVSVFGEEKRKVPYRDYVLSWPEGEERVQFLEETSWIEPYSTEEKDELGQRSLFPDLHVVGASQAASYRKEKYEEEHYEPIDVSGLMEKTVVMRLEGDLACYNGISLYEDMIGGIELVVEGKKLFYKSTPKSYSFNFMFGNAYGLVGIAEEEMADWINTGRLSDRMRLTAVVDDKTLEEWEQH